MRVLFAIKSLSPPPGGAERVLATIASALAERGHSVTVATFDDPDTDDFYPISSLAARVRMGRIRSGTSRAADLLSRVNKLRAVTANTKPEVAVGFMHSAFIPLAIALLGSGIPVVGSERTAYAHYRTRPLERLLLLMTMPLLRQVTVNNRGVRDGFPGPIARRMIVVPNPVAPPPILADPDGGSEKVLLSVGGLRPEKDHTTLIAAFAKLAAEFPNWRLRLVGEGPLRSPLMEQAKALRIAERVEFTGAISDVSREYRSAQLFVLPSRYEAFPNCVAEALSHGLAAVGFQDCPGTNELIIHGTNGLLAQEPDRVDALAIALSKLMADGQLRHTLAQNAPGSVARYKLEAITDEWERLLGAACAGADTTKDHGGSRA